MKIEDFLKGLKYLGLAYSKEFNKEESEVYYGFLKEYDYDVFRLSIKNLIKTTKFIPKISEIVEECEKNKHKIKFDILEKMVKDNYFKDAREYEKAVSYLETGVIPIWFKDDMKKYQQNYLEIGQESLQIETTEEEKEELRKLLEEYR